MTGKNARDLPWWTLAVAILALLAHVIPGVFERIYYLRPAILGGQWWRLLTCHLTHGSVSHMVWNVVVFLALGPLVERQMGRRVYPLFLAASGLIISLGLLAFLPRLVWYCGLSGVVTAVFGFLLVEEWRSARKTRNRFLLFLCGLCAAGFFLKIVYELRFGRMLFVQSSDLPPVPLAHLLGFLAGAAAGYRRIDRD